MSRYIAYIGGNPPRNFHQLKVAVENVDENDPHGLTLFDRKTAEFIFPMDEGNGYWQVEAEHYDPYWAAEIGVRNGRMTLHRLDLEPTD